MLARTTRLLRRVVPAVANMSVERRLQQGAKGRWIGGDAAIPVDLDGQRRLWLFSDSWVGPEGRQTANMVHNSVAIQHLGTGAWTFHNPAEATDFLVGDAGAGWIWPMSAVRRGKDIYVACAVNEADATNHFGARRLGTILVHLKMAGPNPLNWPQTHHTLADFQTLDAGDCYLGAAMAIEGNDLVLLGAREHLHHDQGSRPDGREVFLARLPLDNPGAAPRYLYADGWRTGRPTEAMTLFDAAAPIMALTHAQGVWVAACVHLGAGRQVVWRQAASLEGPWSAPHPLMTCWRPWFRAHHYCYALQIVSQDTERIQLCYSVNSHRGIDEHFRNRRLYWPHTVSVPVPRALGRCRSRSGTAPATSAGSPNPDRSGR